MNVEQLCTTAVVISLTLLSPSVGAEEAPEQTAETAYTLEQCLEIGLERSIPLANARRDELQAQETIKQVRAQAFPSIDLEGSYTRLDEEPSFTTLDGSFPAGREDNYSASAGLDQLLYSGGGVRAGLRAAKHFTTFSTEETARRQAILVRDISKRFYDVLYAEAAVEVSAASVEQLSEFEQQTKLKYEKETASEFDWLSAQVKLINERPKLVQARNNLALAKTALKDLIYLDEEEFNINGELSFSPVEVNLSVLYEAGLGNRPELMQAQMTVLMRGEDIRVSKSDYMPELRAFANYTGTNPGNDEPTADEWAWHWTAGLSASWSILDGGLRKSEIRSKRLEEGKARAELEELTLNIKLEIKNAFLSLNHAREVVTSTQDSVALAEKALEIAKVRYDEGLATYLEFTDSNLALSNARLINVMALRSYLQALADLRYACGTDKLPSLEEKLP